MPFYKLFVLEDLFYSSYYEPVFSLKPYTYSNLSSPLATNNVLFILSSLVIFGLANLYAVFIYYLVFLDFRASKSRFLISFSSRKYILFILLSIAHFNNTFSLYKIILKNYFLHSYLT